MTIPHVRIREIRHRRELCTLGQAVRIWGWGVGGGGKRLFSGGRDQSLRIPGSGWKHAVRTVLIILQFLLKARHSHLLPSETRGNVCVSRPG